MTITPTTKPDAAGVLLAARDSVTEQTWTQSAMFRGDGGRVVQLSYAAERATQWCATGAVTRAAHLAWGAPTTWDDGGDTIWAWDDVLGRVLAALAAGSLWGDVIRWNDAPGRTWEDVWDLLDRAAALAKSAGAGGAR